MGLFSYDITIVEKQMLSGFKKCKFVKLCGGTKTVYLFTIDSCFYLEIDITYSETT